MSARKKKKSGKKSLKSISKPSIYISIRDGLFSKTIRFKDFAVDVDHDYNALGIEVLKYDQLEIGGLSVKGGVLDEEI